MAKRIQQSAQRKPQNTPEQNLLEPLPEDPLRASTEYTVAEAPIPLITTLAEKDEEKALSEDLAPVVDLHTIKKPRRRWLRRSMIIALIIFVIGITAAGAYAYWFAQTQISEKGDKHNVVEQLARIINPNVEKLQGEAEDRINILLLGYGGGNHPGAQLTDTIMVASIQPSTHKVTFVSIPRDLVVPIPPENLKTAQYLKINSVLVHGDLAMEEKIIEMLTGLHIHYHLLVDFTGFVDVINAIGGVNVTVEHAFDGYYGTDQLSSPCPAGKVRDLEDGPYCIISFDSGNQHMDGERALQYSRIRKLTSSSPNKDEAGDYARARRQQIIIQSTKDKILSVGTLLNPIAISNLLNAIGDHVSTNMEIWEMLRFGDMAKNISSDEITNLVIDANPTDGLLVETRSAETGAFITEPKAGLANYTDIHAFIEKALAPETVEEVVGETNTNSNTTTATQEKPKIILQNGSGINGLAATVEAYFEESVTPAIAVASIGNAATRAQSKTIIYDFSGGRFPHTLAHLETLLGVEATSSTRPSSSAVRLSTDADPNILDTSTISANTDMVIVLGKDQQHLSQ